jgi:large subunit ribosomal protein LX
MSEFTVAGAFQSRDGWQTFETAVEAVNEAVAEEHAVAEFGSRHNLSRQQVRIEEVRA